MPELFSIMRYYVKPTIEKVNEYYNSSQKAKIISIGSIAGILVVIFLLTSLSNSPLRRQTIPAFSMIDPDGNKWMLKPMKGQPLSRYQDIRSKLGPPLLIKTDVEIRSGEVSIGLTVLGQAGEKYIGGAYKNGQLQPPPKLKIIDESGKVLDTGQFEYG